MKGFLIRHKPVMAKKTGERTITTEFQMLVNEQVVMNLEDLKKLNPNLTEQILMPRNSMIIHAEVPKSKKLMTPDIYGWMDENWEKNKRTVQKSFKESIGHRFPSPLQHTRSLFSGDGERVALQMCFYAICTIFSHSFLRSRQAEYWRVLLCESDQWKNEKKKKTNILIAGVFQLARQLNYEAHPQQAVKSS